MKKIIFLLILINLIPLSLFAHGDKKHHQKKLDTVLVVGKDTIAINGIAVSDSVLSLHETEEHGTEDHVESEGEFKFNISDALFEHIHNKIIHFPISLAVAAFLFALFGYKDNRYESTIKILLLIAGIFGIVAFITGTLQFDAFLNDPKLWVAETHRVLGIASSISIWLWYFSMILKPMKKFTWLFAVLTVILISATGFYGGVLAH